jgi:transcriptional regulator with XRE-family HTH domain
MHCCCSEGRRRLLALLQSITQATIALKVRVTAACVSYWASGTTVPQYARRVALRDAYGIPLEAWDNPANDASSSAPRAA